MSEAFIGLEKIPVLEAAARTWLRFCMIKEKPA